jgi:hypothetical protein
MTQLVEGRPARLDVGENLRCRIIGFSGPEVVLALEMQPEEEIGREGGVDPGAGPLELTITVTSHEVVAEARIMRVTDSEVGVQFERIEDSDRLLLASLALAYHRPR